MDNEVSGNLGKIFHPHIEDQRTAAERKLLPVDARYLLAVALVAGDKGNGGSKVTVCQRNASIGRRPDRGGYSRHDFKRDSRCHQRLAFFATTTEDEGVSPLQARHHLALLRLFHQHFVDLPLFTVVGTTNLAGIDQLSITACERQQLLVRQIIVENDISPGNAFFPLQGEQARVTGTGADQIDIAVFFTFFSHYSQTTHNFL